MGRGSWAMSNFWRRLRRMWWKGLRKRAQELRGACGRKTVSWRS